MEKSSSYFTVFFLTYLASTVLGDAEDIKLLVQTTTGPIRGQLVTGHTQKRGRAFYGIPYVEPPLGKLRFKPPVPVTPWTEVLDTTKVPLPCYQQYTKQLFTLSKLTDTTIRRPWSEDCLTLNVWAPDITPEDAPVIIFFHGGQFMTGTGIYPYFELTTYAAETLEISISFNYRVGALGFLRLGSSYAPGNMGLMDQQLAIKWVCDNVREFGGKPDAIFLLGIGAGGVSVGFQIINDKNAGLFRTGILSTSTPICPFAWHTKEKAVELGKQLSQSIACGNDNVTAELECLQNVHPDDIVDAYRHMENDEMFKPTIDGLFIKEDPREAMKMGRFNNVTFVGGNPANDASMMFYSLNKDIMTPGSGLTRKGFDEAMKRSGLSLTDTQLAVVSEWYLSEGREMNEVEIRDAAVRAYTDSFSVCCLEELLRYGTENGVLAYRSVFDVKDPKHPSWIGSHEHIGYQIFTAEVLNPKLNFCDEVKHAVMDFMMVSRIYTRRKAREFQELFPLYNLEDRPYLFWGDQKFPANNYRREECVLWDRILPAIGKAEKSCTSQ